MNNEEIKLTEYLHNIIENNMSLRRENNRLWKQKLEYINRISKAIEYLKKNSFGISYMEISYLLEILKGSDKE